MRERVQLFGKPSSLVGVISEPSQVDARERPAVILLNAGVIHRVGPNRLYVQIARAVAEAGFLALRLDGSGRGDSDVRPSTASFAEGDVKEIQDVMTYLAASRGVGTFVLMGICSGAALAFSIACADRRVAGIVGIEPYIYPTLGFHMRYYARRIFRAASWWNTLTGRNALGRRLLGGWRSAGGPLVDAEMAGATVGPQTVPRETVVQALRDLIARNLRLCMLFSGGGAGGVGVCNYRGQFVAAFPGVDFKDCLRVELIRDADHTFTLLSNQRRLLKTIREWMTATFPVETRETPRT